MKRDELVFRAARSRGVPVLMVTSGGYQKRTARIIADSILNLHSLGFLGREQAACALGSPSLDQVVRDSAKDFSNLSLQ